MIGDRVIDFKFTVNDFYLFLYFRENEMNEEVVMLFFNCGVPISDLSQEEYTQLINLIHINDRFIKWNTNEKTNDIPFEWTLDWDLIYPELLHKFPHIFKNEEDILECDYFKFLNLFNYCRNDLNARISVRVREPRKLTGLKGKSYENAIEENNKIEESKLNIRVDENNLFNVYKR